MLPFQNIPPLLKGTDNTDKLTEPGFVSAVSSSLDIGGFLRERIEMVFCGSLDTLST